MLALIGLLDTSYMAIGLEETKGMAARRAGGDRGDYERMGLSRHSAGSGAGDNGGNGGGGGGGGGGGDGGGGGNVQYLEEDEEEIDLETL